MSWMFGKVWYPPSTVSHSQLPAICIVSRSSFRPSKFSAAGFSPRAANETAEHLCEMVRKFKRVNFDEIKNAKPSILIALFIYYSQTFSVIRGLPLSAISLPTVACSFLPHSDIWQIENSNTLISIDFIVLSTPFVRSSILQIEFGINFFVARFSFRKLRLVGFVDIFFRLLHRSLARITPRMNFDGFDACAIGGSFWLLWCGG